MSSRTWTLAWLYFLAGAVFLLDQVTKLLVEARFPSSPGGVTLISWWDFLRLHYVTNPGAAWGILPGQTWLFVVVAGLVSLVCLWFMHRYPQTTASWPVALLLAGGLGNMVDRLLRPTGVVDFIDMGIYDLRWPTFNLADLFLTVGIFWLGKVILMRQLPWDEPEEGLEETTTRG